MKKIIFYYGIDIPSKELLDSYREATLIVQPYHPISQSNNWRNFVSVDQQVFLYFNCYKIQKTIYDCLPTKPKILDQESLWKTVTLDLTDPANYQYKLQEARDLFDSIKCDGIFIDDLDCATSIEQKNKLVSLIHEIHQYTKKPFVINRGFHLWNDLPDVKSIVLESFVPHQYPSHSDLDWFKMVIDANISLLKKISPHISMHVLKYKERDIELKDEFTVKADGLQAILDGYAIPTIHGHQGLDKWPAYLS